MNAAPSVWLLLSDKLGDNAQARIVADAMGLPYQERVVRMQERWVFGKPRFRATIDHLDPSRSDRLEPPWPDAIITIGRRPAMAALWVREQAGKPVKIIQVGRAKRKLAEFDLVIAAPQFRVQPEPNVLHLELPLIRADHAKIEAARDTWQATFDGLPKPVTACLIGGPTRPFDMPQALIANSFNALRSDGTLYVTTSRRTPKPITDWLKTQGDARTIIHCWGDDMAENPYFGLLAHADRFAVTGDSISMLIEVADCQKPLAIIDLPVTKNLRSFGLFMARRLARKLDPGGRFGSPRDLRFVHDKLIAAGAATRLSDGFPSGPFEGLAGELVRVGARVREVILA